MTLHLLPPRILTAAVFLVYGFSHLGYMPTALGVSVFLIMMAASCVILYSLWMIGASLAFYVIKLEQLNALLAQVFEAARWPSGVFSGGLRFVFTFLIPLIVITTFPAEALLGQLSLGKLAASLGTAAVTAFVSRVVWTRAIARYRSASS